ncbi:MAG: amidohydrolase family protein [Planctomycetes bacterium]|nr:amidohydrolase family protein [Planctomycetota bacterium]
MTPLPKGRIVFLLLTVLVGTSLAQSGTEGAVSGATTIAITGGRVLLDPARAPEVATVLIADGKITAVGKDVAVPAGARVVDASGHVVAPAFIDAGNLGLIDSGSVSAGPTGSGDRVVDMMVAWDEQSRLDLLRAGVGGLYVDLPPSGRRFRGPTGAVVLVDPEGASPPILEAIAGVTFRVGGSNRATSSVQTRSASLRNITAAFSAADRHKKALDKYKKDLAEYEKKLAAWKKNKDGKNGKKSAEKKADGKKPEEKPRRTPAKRPDNWDTMTPQEKSKWSRENARRGSSTAKSAPPSKKEDGEPSRPTKPTRDPASESMLRIVDGEAPLRVEAHWKEDILAVLSLAKDKKVRCVLLGGSESWRCMEEIKEAGASVILGPPVRLGGDRIDWYRARPDLAKLLHDADVPFAFMTAGAHGYRLDCAPLLASLSVANGLDDAAALHALTAGAATIVGLGSRLGSIEKGKDALIQVLTGMPLEPDTSVAHMVVGGRVVNVAGRRP